MKRHLRMALCSALPLLALACTTAAGPKNLQTARALIQATEEQDIEKLMSGFADDAVFAQPFNPAGPDYAYEGKAAVRKGFEGIFGLMETLGYKDKRYTVSDDGNAVFLEAQGQMTLAGSGKEYDNFYVFRVDFDADGRVTKLTEYMNSLYLVNTIDLSRTRP